MADTSLQITQGSGTRLRTYTRSVGGVTVHSEFAVEDEPTFASYVVTAGGVSTATANSHLIQIMAGASLPVSIRRVRIRQRIAASSSNIDAIQFFRLTSAGTGGTTKLARVLDPNDTGAGATAMTLPGVKGTEGQQLWEETITLLAAGPFDNIFEWTAMARTKGFIINPGTSNGFVVKNTAAVAGAQVDINIEFVELEAL